jgi:hypothetical protein
MKTYVRLLPIAFFLILVAAIGLSWEQVQFNLTNLQLSRLIVPSPDGSASYGELLSQVGTSYVESSADGEVAPSALSERCSSGGSSLAAWLMAVQSHYRRDFGETGGWLLEAAKEFQNSQVELPVMLPTYIEPDAETGNIQFQWDSYNWARRADSRYLSVESDSTGQILTLSYENRPQERDRAVYAWRGSLDLPYWREFQVDAKISEGAYLTVEVRTENGLERFVNYRRGQGEWETFVFPFEGTELRHIYFMLGEPANAVNADTPTYEVQLKPVKMLLATELQTCKSP